MMKKDGLLLEDIRRQTHAGSFTAENEKEIEIKEKMLACLERCMDKLVASNRELITRYYAGKERIKIENRRALAEEFGITLNALSIRACRIRDRLEDCVRSCVGAG
jgi:hypothetical protein